MFLQTVGLIFVFVEREYLAIPANKEYCVYEHKKRFYVQKNYLWQNYEILWLFWKNIYVISVYLIILNILLKKESFSKVSDLEKNFFRDIMEQVDKIVVSVISFKLKNSSSIGYSLGALSILGTRL